MGSVFGFEVSSALPLERLREAPGTRGEIGIELADHSILDEAAEISGIDVLELPDGTTSAFVVGRAGRRHIIGCSHTGGYRIDADELLIEAAPDGTPELWEHRILSVVIPILLACRGEVALHGSAVEIDGAGIIFCGPAFRGKSTLATAYAELGFPVLSEDGVVLEQEDQGWVAWPAASGARIRQEEPAEPAKVLRNLPGPEPHPVQAGALVLLQPRGGDGEPLPLSVPDALIRTAPHLMHGGGLDLVRPAFAGLARVLSTLPAFSVSLPDDLAKLPEAADRMGRRLASAGGRGV
jgi:hypothetical protein